MAAAFDHRFEHGWREPLYRPGTVCPGCNNQQWEVGRNVAECAICHTALTLAPEARLIGGTELNGGGQS